MSEEIKNEEIEIVPQLTLELLNAPIGGDNGDVFATDLGWECKYPDGYQEILVECKGLLKEFARLGLDSKGKPVEAPQPEYKPGDIISHTVTLELLESLKDLAELRKIGNPIGVKGVSIDKLREDIAVKLGLK
ncbi:hypothetical protein HWB92_gp200 [Serratia phage vB_SmaA_3M]|uniref:Uncharacterized protein n=1 Tax=Serratia phage vB_SmaA_3M TaxID=2419930 RepID=A0A3G2YSE9_9CAUD|nr:hypothetical protein HWB92_gp200 [Serratia phage vB_SmaA_3M]AYP28458.1 hypothetical protein 3M_202c [Serratia phage vB_SmaA_3M]